MAASESGRRDFLKQGAFTTLGLLLGGPVARVSYAASKERLTILSSIGLDSLHPYAHSSSPQYGIWNNMAEPLVEVSYAKRDYFGVLADSWEFQGKKWIFKLRKNVRFHDGSLSQPMTSSIPSTESRMTSRACRKITFAT